MKMKITPLWRAFGSSIHQGFLHENPDLYSAIKELLISINPDYIDELIQFLKNLTETGLSSEEMFEIWEQSGAEYYSLPIDQFLSMIKEIAINESLSIKNVKNKNGPE
jgi:hypothetical protein